MNKSIAAIILAAGYSSRLGDFKPLLRLDGLTLVERAVALFQEAGVGRIVVVAGHRGDEVAAVAETAKADWVLNPGYDDGMFSSVTTGLTALGSTVEAFLMLPVDIPLVRPETVRRLLRAYPDHPGSILYPSFQGRRGHPPVIPMALAGDILAWPGQGGLKGCLARHQDRAVDLVVPDRNILFDVDTGTDAGELFRRWENRHIPTPEECQVILGEIHPVSPRILNHGRATARVATALAEEINQAGGQVDIDLVRVGALLHDLAKGEPDHARTGGQWLCETGFPRVGEVAAAHTQPEIDRSGPITEEELVFLADKYLQCDRRVSIAERFQPALERFAAIPEALSLAKGRLELAELVKGRVETRIGKTIEEILDSRGLGNGVQVRGK